MVKVLFAFTIGNILYTIVCIRLDIAHAMGVVIIYMSNSGKKSNGK